MDNPLTTELIEDARALVHGLEALLAHLPEGADAAAMQVLACRAGGMLDRAYSAMLEDTAATWPALAEAA